MASCYHSPINL